MTNIFEQGSFKDYSIYSLREARSPIYEFSQYYGRKTTVFISHKHDDLDDLKGVLGFLQQQYGVRVYIDSRDPAMPKKTNPETAAKIKNRIKQCDKFILLATNAAVESKWCNWELGYGDAQKYDKNIALFPMKPKDAVDAQYKGSEYLGIYPSVVYNDLLKYSCSSPDPYGYYVKNTVNGDPQYISLENWLKI